MKKYLKYYLLLAIGIFLFFFSCNKKEETILKGKTSILVDETLLPILEDQVLVFENTYEAKIKLLPKSEKESILALSKKEADIIVLPRKLNNEELKMFNKTKIVPRSTKFAIDAIVFINNKKSNDTLLDLNDVLDFMKGKKNKIKGLVFDNPNSSTVNYINSLAKIDELPKEGVFSFKTNDEVIKYVANNQGMIGVVGLNWLTQPQPIMKQYVDELKIMSLKAEGTKDYIYPNQETIAYKEYPLARDLYIINCQGFSGLGMGFASFIAGEKGQRIVLKSGLLPAIIPSRNIRIRDKIINDKK